MPVAQQGMEKRGATSRESRRWSYLHLQPGLHLNSCLQNCSRCQCFPQGFPDLQVPPGRPVVIQMFKGHTGAQAGVRGWGCTWAPRGALRGVLRLVRWARWVYVRVRGACGESAPRGKGLHRRRDSDVCQTRESFFRKICGILNHFNEGAPQVCLAFCQREASTLWESGTLYPGI